MSDEEKKAIKRLEKFGDSISCSNYPPEAYIEMKEDIEDILNLIEKQSKEIEELKAYKHDAELTKIACCTAQNCEALNNCIKLERELQNADNKWKDKIKAKIEEVEQLELYNMKIPRLSTLDERLGAKIGIKYVLQSLLEKE